MSKICVVFLESYLLTEEENIIQNYLSPHALRLVIYSSNNMQFSICGYECIGRTSFSISDAGVYDNCEMFLLPDNCVYNGVTNKIPFVERMKYIEVVMRFVLKRQENVSLFIGECEAFFADYQNYSVRIDELLPALCRLNSIEQVSLHLVINR